MKYLKLFEEFNENEPAVIVNELKELDKIYRYLFSYDDALKHFEIDTTNITEDQGLNYWYNINFFELKNGEPIYYWKVSLNITQDDYQSPQDIEAEEASAEETATAPVEPQEEAAIEEEAEEIDTNDDKPDKPNIEECFMKVVKLDVDGNALTTWSDRVKIADIIEVDWLLDKLDDISNKTLKVPNTQADVEKTKKDIQGIKNLNYH